MNAAEKYLNRNDLERKYNNIEITFQGMVDHLTQFSYEQNKELRELLKRSSEATSRALCGETIREYSHLQAEIDQTLKK